VGYGGTRNGLERVRVWSYCFIGRGRYESLNARRYYQGVDIPIHLYSLYSDLKPDWNRVYATQPEVLEYWNDLIERHGS
jgi:hypothetical protein